MSLIAGVVSWFTGSELGRYLALGLLILAGVGIVVWRIQAFARRDALAEANLKNLQDTLQTVTERLKVDEELHNLTAEQRRNRVLAWAKARAHP